eukprot:gene4582-biopygen19026
MAPGARDMAPGARDMAPGAREPGTNPENARGAKLSRAFTDVSRVLQQHLLPVLLLRAVLRVHRLLQVVAQEPHAVVAEPLLLGETAEDAGGWGGLSRPLCTFTVW